MSDGAATGVRLQPVDYGQLHGWIDDDHAAAWQAFRLSAAYAAEHMPKTRALGFDGASLAAAARHALTHPTTLATGEARAFFERHFEPIEIVQDSGGAFFTGFYEPEVDASLTPTERFTVPLYSPPAELVEVADGADSSRLEPGMRFARQTEAGVEPFYERGEIERGALSGRGLEIAYLTDPVDAFFIHIQGAARLRLPDGALMRVTYAAKSGHAYTPIGRVLVQRGALQTGTVTMQSIRAWMAAHPDEAWLARWENRSFIFFREAAVDDPALGPIAAAKVPLTAGRSLAVDRTLHTFHMPVWIDTVLPETEGRRPFRQLMIAQDTGSAIIGPARGDIFFGSGDAAGRIAGGMVGRGRFVVLKPRSSA